MEELRENCDENCEIALMANKIDLINEDPSLRQVSLEGVQDFCKTNGLIFVGETSAKEDINIKETFEELLSRVH